MSVDIIDNIIVVLFSGRSDLGPEMGYEAVGLIDAKLDTISYFRLDLWA